jgi:hypothetical protein
MKFFHINGPNTSNLRFSNLKLSVEQQEGNFAGVAAWEATGFEIGGTSDVSISNVKMDFRATNPKSNVGSCIVLDRGTHNIKVSDIECLNARNGAFIMLEGLANGPGIQWYRTDGASGTGISNISIKNFTFDGEVATGWKNEMGNDEIRNVTWDGVNVLAGTAITNQECYLLCGCSDEFSHSCMARDAGVNWDGSPIVGYPWPAYHNIVFSNYKGSVGAQPAAGWGCPPNATECSISFPNWGGGLGNKQGT